MSAVRKFAFQFAITMKAIKHLRLSRPALESRATNALLASLALSITALASPLLPEDALKSFQLGDEAALVKNYRLPATKRLEE